MKIGITQKTKSPFGGFLLYKKLLRPAVDEQCRQAVFFQRRARASATLFVYLFEKNLHKNEL